MNTTKKTALLVSLLALFALAGCEKRSDTTVITPGAGASAPMTGDTGSMSPAGSAPGMTPPAAGASR